MNLFVRIGDEIITPPLDGTFLPGITRESVLTLLRDWGMKVSERKLSIDELREAHKKGELREVFGTGTAAVISPVGALGFQEGQMVIGDGKVGEVSKRLAIAPHQPAPLRHRHRHPVRHAAGPPRLDDAHQVAAVLPLSAVEKHRGSGP